VAEEEAAELTVLKNDHEEAVIEFVRTEVLSARIGEPITLIDRPEQDTRNAEAVEQRWASASHRYAVEHTRIESFEGQIGSERSLGPLLLPIEQRLAGLVPGSFEISVSEGAAVTKPKRAAAQDEICRLVLEAAPTMEVKDRRTLTSNALPFPMELVRRHADGSEVSPRYVIGDLSRRRRERIARAFDDRWPKLRAAAVDGYESVLLFESNDIQLADAFAILEAVKDVLMTRADRPDVIVLVDTEVPPWSAWIYRDHTTVGHTVPFLDDEHWYRRGDTSKRVTMCD